MAGTNAGVAAAIDHTNGLHDRFAHPADAARRCPASPARSTRPCSRVARAAILLVGAAVAARLPVPRRRARRRSPGSSCSSCWPAAMSALFGRIGDRLRRPDVVQFAGMMVMMPFMFVSERVRPARHHARLDASPRRRSTRSPTPPTPCAATCSAPPPPATSSSASWRRLRCGSRHRRADQRPMSLQGQAATSIEATIASRSAWPGWGPASADGTGRNSSIAWSMWAPWYTGPWVWTQVVIPRRRSGRPRAGTWRRRPSRPTG